MGFANYYFNRLKQEDLLYELQKLGKFGSDDARWTMQGTVSDETPFRLVVTSVAGLLESPAKEVSLFDLERAETYSAGWNQEGLILAFHQCQQLLTQGQDPFAEFYYVGSEPLDGNGPRVDVLATMQSGWQTRLVFRSGTKSSGRLGHLAKRACSRMRRENHELGQTGKLFSTSRICGEISWKSRPQISGLQPGD